MEEKKDYNENYKTIRIRTKDYNELLKVVNKTRVPIVELVNISVAMLKRKYRVKEDNGEL